VGHCMSLLGTPLVRGRAGWVRAAGDAVVVGAKVAGTAAGGAAAVDQGADVDEDSHCCRFGCVAMMGFCWGDGKRGC
jgi:hypothetical protein